MDPIVIVMPAFFTLIGFVAWVAVTGWQRRHHARLVADFNVRLLDRLGSVKDFTDFLETSAGAAFIKSLSSDMPLSRPQDRIMRAAQIGIVALSLGVGLFSVGRWIAFEEPESKQFFTALGLITLSLGAGFIISAFAAYRLASTLGVIDRRDHA